MLSAQKLAFAKLKERVIQVLKSDEQLSKDAAVKRITAGISSYEFLTSADKIRNAGELLGLRITKQEIADWKNLRNEPAHGDFDFDFGDPLEIQLALNRTASVANMINKYVLALIGYKGPFRDYGAPGHPRRNFPE